MKTIYLINSSCGYYDDYYTTTVCAFDNLEKAQEYVEKYNRILGKLKQFYKHFDRDEMDDLENDSPEVQLLLKYMNIGDEHEARIEEIELR